MKQWETAIGVLFLKRVGLRQGQTVIDFGARVGHYTIPAAKVVGPRFGEKLYIQKLRRRKNSRRRTGHRQVFTQVRIERISA